jgi:hypothetical protein
MNEGIPPQTPPLGEKKRGVHVNRSSTQAPVHDLRPPLTFRYNTP